MSNNYHIPNKKIFSLICSEDEVYGMIKDQDDRFKEYLINTGSKAIRIWLEPVNNTNESEIQQAIKLKKLVEDHIVFRGECAEPKTEGCVLCFLKKQLQGLLEESKEINNIEDWREALTDD